MLGTNTEIDIQLAIIAAHHGDKDDAEQIFNQAIRSADTRIGRAVALLNKGVFHLTQGDSNKAINTLEELSRCSISTIRALYLSHTAKAHLAVDAIEEAAERFRAANKIFVLSQQQDETLNLDNIAWWMKATRHFGARLQLARQAWRPGRGYRGKILLLLIWPGGCNPEINYVRTV